MPTLKTICLSLISVALLALLACYIAMHHWLYVVRDSGELILANAPGEVKITREADSQILHIKGDSWESIAYGQGFACA